MHITRTQAEMEKTSERTEPPSYKAAVIDQPGSVLYIERPKVCGPGEILVRTEGVGLCASNIPVWEGREWFQYPLKPGAPGHEAWGIIQQTGEKVKTLKNGDRVAVLQGNAFAEYVTVSAEDVVILPAALDGIPFPGEPLGCLMNILARADIQEGQTVAIVGLGFLGLGLINLCKQKGAKVIALSRRDSSLQIAADEADLCIKMEDHFSVVRQINEYTDGKGCARVIECTGKQWPLDLATEVIGEYGKLIIAGYHQDGLRQVNMQQWNWKAIDVINAHERDTMKYKEGMAAAIDAVTSGTIQPSRLLTHEFKFEELAEGLQLLKECPEGFIKAFVKF